MNSPWKKIKLLNGFFTFETDLGADFDAGCLTFEAGF
jgi:hypothetical protein